MYLLTTKLKLLVKRLVQPSQLKNKCMKRKKMAQIGVNGWVDDQLAMWPVQEGYIKSIKGTHLEGKCGKPGLNGGYQPDKNLKLSANCYGYRPRPNENYIHYLEKNYEKYK